MSNTTREELRMDAYYYSFEPTGVLAIDKVLSAVATAGKHYHNTDQWQDEGEQTAIQTAANEAKNLIQSEITKAGEQGVKSAATYWEAKFNRLKNGVEDSITKAQEQLLDELEDESIEETIVILGHTKMIKKIPFSAIEDKRKELKEKNGKA